jgi:hypothetical protein
MDEALSDKQLQLLIALRELERSGELVDFAKLARATGYSESSVRTYFTKRLDGFVAFRGEDGWRVRGATRTSEETFAKRLSQKAGSANEALRTQESWRALAAAPLPARPRGARADRGPRRRAGGPRAPHDGRDRGAAEPLRLMTPGSGPSAPDGGSR